LLDPAVQFVKLSLPCSGSKAATLACSMNLKLNPQLSLHKQGFERVAKNNHRLEQDHMLFSQAPHFGLYKG
ncbi:MAG: hypothetical protein RR824_09615, partial [Clostridia bacterium]